MHSRRDGSVRAPEQYCRTPVGIEYPCSVEKRSSLDKANTSTPIQNGKNRHDSKQKPPTQGWTKRRLAIGASVAAIIPAALFGQNILQGDSIPSSNACKNDGSTLVLTPGKGNVPSTTSEIGQDDWATPGRESIPGATNNMADFGERVEELNPGVNASVLPQRPLRFPASCLSLDR